MNGFQLPVLLGGLSLGFITGGVVLFGQVSGHDEALASHDARIISAERDVDVVGAQVDDIHRTVVGIEVRQTSMLDSVKRIERVLDGMGDNNE